MSWLPKPYILRTLDYLQSLLLLGELCCLDSSARLAIRVLVAPLAVVSEVPPAWPRLGVGVRGLHDCAAAAGAAALAVPAVLGKPGPCAWERTVNMLGVDKSLERDFLIWKRLVWQC